MDRPRWERLDPPENQSERVQLLAGHPPQQPTRYYCAQPLTDPSQLIVAVVGPTASGKSDLALDLAQSMPGLMGAKGGEVVGADALQLYQGMDIGTAKTPLQERRGIAHHQIDVLDIHDEASVAYYQKYARADVSHIHARTNVAVVAGGSGLYQRALLDVIDFPGTDKNIRQRIEKEAQSLDGTHELHARLMRLDPVAAQRIDPANIRRIVRALEVIELTGKPFSANMPRHEYLAPTVAIAIAWEGPALDERIVLRTKRMFDAGLLEEVRELLDQGLREAKTASRATGYAQAIAVIDGQMSVNEAIESVALATRQLARRQVKWLRPDPRIHWIHAGIPGGVHAEAMRIVTNELAQYES